MKKKNIILLITILIISVISGCGTSDKKEEDIVNGAVSNFIIVENINDVQETEEIPQPSYEEIEEPSEEIFAVPTQEEIDALNIPEDMLAYWLVLNDKKPFIDTNLGGQEFYLSEYHWDGGCENIEYNKESDHFLLLDLDGDGGKEFITYTGFPERTQVFHYEDGEVYSYSFRFRGMKCFYENGVYNGATSASEGGWYRIMEFRPDGCTKETLLYQDDYYYEVDGREVSQEEYAIAYDNIVCGPEAEDYEMNEDTLNVMLLNGLSDEEIRLLRGIEKEELADKDITYSFGDKEAEAYRRVLRNEESFVLVSDTNKTIFMDKYQEQLISPDILYFNIIDLDNDGVMELILNRELNKIQILHYNNGIVYSYSAEKTKDILVITKDGVCSSTLYEEEAQFRIISFNEDGYQTEVVDYNGNPYHDAVRYHFYSEEIIERYLK